MPAGSVRFVRFARRARKRRRRIDFENSCIISYSTMGGGARLYRHREGTSSCRYSPIPGCSARTGAGQDVHRWHSKDGRSRSQYLQSSTDVDAPMIIMYSLRRFNLAVGCSPVFPCAASGRLASRSRASRSGIREMLSSTGRPAERNRQAISGMLPE